MAEVVLGSLYIAHCRAFNRTTGELTKLKLLLVGGELDDVERRIRWVLDYAAYDELSITEVEKIREKVHILSSVTTFPDAPEKVVIDREGSQQPVRLPPNGLHVEDANVCGRTRHYCFCSRRKTRRSQSWVCPFKSRLLLEYVSNSAIRRLYANH